MSQIKWRKSFEECLLSRERWVDLFGCYDNGIDDHGGGVC